MKHEHEATECEMYILNNLTKKRPTFSTKGIKPAVRTTASAPTGRTHAGASTVPGSAAPTVNSVVAELTRVAAASTDCSGETIILHGSDTGRLDILPNFTHGDGAINASATGYRDRRAVVIENFMLLGCKCGAVRKFPDFPIRYRLFCKRKPQEI